MQLALTIPRSNIGSNFVLTKHALERVVTRSISSTALRAALEFGRVVYTRGAQIFAIGRREVEEYARDGFDLTKFEGIQVVVTDDGAIMTAYRNKSFRGLRPGCRRRSR